MKESKEKILASLRSHLSDTLLDFMDHVHDGTLTSEEVAGVLFDELEDWIAYHASLMNASEAIKYALGQRVS